MIQPGGPAGNGIGCTSILQIPRSILELQHLLTGAEAKQEVKCAIADVRDADLPQDIRNREVKISHHMGLGKFSLTMDIKNQIYSL